MGCNCKLIRYSFEYRDKEIKVVTEGFGLCMCMCCMLLWLFLWGTICADYYYYALCFNWLSLTFLSQLTFFAAASRVYYI